MRLLDLASYSQAADARLQEAAVYFAARLEPVQQLSTGCLSREGSVESLMIANPHPSDGISLKNANRAMVL